MRILYLSQLLPYPTDAGPKVRIYHVLQYLASVGHQITLVAFQRESDSRDDINHLRRYCHEIHMVPIHRSLARDTWDLAHSFLTRRSFLISRDTVTALHQKLDTLLTREAFDAVHADQLWMAQYALAAKTKFGRSRAPIFVLDEHNATYLIPKRLANGTQNPVKRMMLSLESRLLARYEVETCQVFDHVVWVTDEDRRAVAGVANGAWGARRDCVIPICLDPERQVIIPRQPSARRVTFLGGLHWPPNREGILWFAREVWPLIRAQVPDAILTIIGKKPPAHLARSGSAVNNMQVTGYLADPTPYLAETAAFIVPLHAGGGMRVKILDAWSRGLPVVSTTIGAEGILFEDGENGLLADSPSAFARAVVQLLREPEHAAQLGLAGRSMVDQQYNWRRVYPAWDNIYRATG